MNMHLAGFTFSNTHSSATLKRAKIAQVLNDRLDARRYDDTQWVILTTDTAEQIEADVRRAVRFEPRDFLMVATCSEIRINGHVLRPPLLSSTSSAQKSLDEAREALNRVFGLPPTFTPFKF